MSGSNKILLAIVAVAFIAGVLFFSSMSVHDNVVSYESSIEAAKTESMNEMSSYRTKLKESVQIPALYTENATKILDAYVQGTKLDGVSINATAVQAYMARNVPELKDAMYNKMMDIIDNGRSNFATKQRILIDKCRSYKTYTHKWWNSKFVPSGYPTKDIDVWCKIVVSADTQQIFSTGVDEVVQLK